MRTLTRDGLAAVGGGATGVTCVVASVGAPLGLPAVVPVGEGPVGLVVLFVGLRATKPMMAAMASAPTTAATSMPFDPDLPGGCDMSGAPAAGESLGTASGDGMLPGSLPVGDR